MTTPRQTVPSFRELSQACGTRKQAKANRSGFSASRSAAKFDRQIRLLLETVCRCLGPLEIFG